MHIGIEVEKVWKSVKKVIICVIALMPVPRIISNSTVSTYQPGHILKDIIPNNSKKVIKNAQSI